MTNCSDSIIEILDAGDIGALRRMFPEETMLKLPFAKFDDIPEQFGKCQVSSMHFNLAGGDTSKIEAAPEHGTFCAVYGWIDEKSDPLVGLIGEFVLFFDGQQGYALNSGIRFIQDGGSVGN